MKRFFVLLIISLFMLVSCGGGDDKQNDVQNLQVGSLQIDPSADVVIADNLPIGLSVPFNATAFYTNNTKVLEDYTTKVAWRIESGNNLASIDPATGVLSANALGSVLISAADQSSNISTTKQVNLVDDKLSSMTIEEPTLPGDKLPLDITEQLNANGIFSSKSGFDITNSVHWVSDTPNVVEVVDDVDKKGLIKALTADQPATITATWNHNGVNQSAQVIINTSSAKLLKLTLEPKELVINNQVPVNVTIPYEVIGKFDDGHDYDLTNQVKLQSIGSDKDQHVIVTPGGNVTALTPGNIILEASINKVVARTFLAVTNEQPKSVHIEPVNNSNQHAILKGGLLAMKAIGVFEPSGMSYDITNSVTWVSESNAIVFRRQGSVNGLANGIKATNPNPVNVYAVSSSNAVNSNKYPLIVIDAIASASLSPNNKTLYVEIPQQYLALGYADDYQLDLTDMYTWRVNPANLGIIKNTYGSKGLFIPKLAGHDGVINANSAKLNSTSANFKIVDKHVVSVSINGSPESVAKYVAIRLTAQATLDDGTTIDITNSDSTSWFSSESNVIQYAKTKGQFVSESAGTAVLSVIFNNAANSTIESASVTVVVNNADIVGLSVSPNPSTIVTNGEQKFTALLIDSESNTYAADQFGLVSWTSSSPTNLDIDPVTGVATAGNTAENGIVVTAQLLTGNNVNKSATANVNIVAAHLDGIIISPNKATLDVGGSITYSAEALYSNPILRIPLLAPDQVKWSIDQSQYASIDTDGRLNALQVGSLNVSAQLISQGKLDSRPEASTSVALSIIDATTDQFESLEIISNNNTPLAIGQKRSYSVVAHYQHHDDTNVDINSLSWSSSKESVATINSIATSDEFGVATAKSDGTTIIRAKLAPYTESAAISLVVSSALTLESIEITGSHQGALNDRLSYHAYGYYSDANGNLVSNHVDITKQVSWTIAPSDFGTFGSGATSNILTILKTGAANITATLAGVSSAPFALSISNGTNLESIVITSIGSDIIQVGATKQYKVIAIYNNISDNDVTDTATWFTESSAIATIDNINQKGKLTGLSKGTTNVVAVYANKSVKRAITVVGPDTTNQLESVWLRDTVTNHDYKVSESLTLTYRATRQFALMARYGDGTIQAIDPQLVRWISADSTKVSFDDGNAIVLESGVTTDISGSYTELGVSKVTPPVHINVPVASLSKLVINAHAESVPVGSSISFSAAGYFGVGDITGVNPLTSGIIWSSNNSKVSFADPIKGIAQVAADANPGPVVITVRSVTNPSIESQTTIEIITGAPSTLESVYILPADYVFTESGQSKQYVLMAHYSDSGLDHQIDNSEIDWSSSVESIIAIDDNGIATALSPGTVIISASYRNKVVTTKATFTPEVVKGLSLMPFGDAVHIYHIGLSVKGEAIATTESHGKIYVSSAATWLAVDPQVVRIDRGSDSSSPVNIIGLKAGHTWINVNYQGNLESLEVYVSNDTIEQISLLPAESFVVGVNESIPNYYQVVGYFKDANNIVHYQAIESDGSNFLVSSDATKATVDSSGSLTGVAIGGATITANYGGKTSSANVVVDNSVQLESIIVIPRIESTITNNLVCYVVLAHIGNQMINVSRSAIIDAGTAGKQIKDSTCIDSSNTQLSGTLIKVAAVANITNSLKITYAGQNFAIGSLTTLPVTVIAEPINIEDRDIEAYGTVHPGLYQQLVATDNNGLDVTNLVNWSSSDLDRVKVGVNGLVYTLKLSLAGNIIVKADYPGLSEATLQDTVSTAGYSSDPGTPALQMLVMQDFAGTNSIDDATALYVGNKAYVQVKANFEDNTSQDVTNYVPVISNNANVLAYNQLTHFVTALKPVADNNSVGLTTWLSEVHSESIANAESGLFIHAASNLTDITIETDASGENPQFSLTGKYNGLPVILTYDGFWQSGACSNSINCGIDIIPIGRLAGYGITYGNDQTGTATISVTGFNPNNLADSISKIFDLDTP